MSSGKSYCQGGLSGIRLILVGREGNHVVERSCLLTAALAEHHGITENS